MIKRKRDIRKTRTPLLCLSQTILLALLLGVSVAYQAKERTTNAITNKKEIRDGSLSDNNINPYQLLDILNNLKTNDNDFSINDIAFYRTIDIYGKSLDEDIAYLIHFNDDAGFVIFDDNQIYYAISGNYSFLKSNKYVYDFNEGIMLIDDQLKLYHVDLNSGSVLENSRIDVNDVNSFDGKDGGISNSELDSYVGEQHPRWIPYSTMIIGDYVRRHQWGTSFYYQTYNYFDGSHGNKLSEGNCALNAMANYFLNLPNVSSPGGIYYHYNQEFNEGNQNVNRYLYFAGMNDYFSEDYSNNTILNTFNNPGESDIESFSWRLREQYNPYWNLDTDTYWFVRNEAIERDYHPHNGFYTRTYAEDTMETVALYYFSSTINIFNTTSITNVVNNIDYGIPVVISVNNSMEYHNHTMLIYGYKKYAYEASVFSFPLGFHTETVYAYLWLVDDNWSTQPTWYDPFKSSDNMYFCTERTSLIWPNC